MPTPIRSFAAATLLLILGACKPTGAAARDDGLVIQNPSSDRPTFHDLGNLAYGERAEHVFRIKNGDPEPVTILDMIPSCGCAVPRVAYRGSDGIEVEGRKGDPADVITLPSGAVADLTIAIDTTIVERMNIDKLAQVRVRSDSKNTPYLTLELHLIVERAFRSVPDKVDLGATPRSAGKSARADVSVDRVTSGAKIVGVADVKGPFEATVDRTDIHGQEVWIMVVSAKPGLPLGPVFGNVSLSTTGMDGTGSGPAFVIPVSAQITQDVVLTPATLQLGSIDPDGVHSVRATLTALVPGERFIVRKATVAGSSADLLRLEFEPVSPDEQGRARDWEVELFAPQLASGEAFSGWVKFELDHPTVPTLDVPYSGSVR